MLDLCLYRRLGDFAVDVRLQAGPGVTALFGPSGSGKSSIISMVAGLARPDRGHVRVDGTILYDSAAKIDLPPERRHLGYVFQDGRLFPHLSVLDNLKFGYQRLPSSRRTIPLEPVIQVLGIGHLLDRRPANLSGGEKQRVAIGRALLCSPRLLLMDEPLAALDERRKDEVLPFIATLSRQFAIPILYVSHSMDEVLRLADTLVLLDQGRIAACGAVEEVLSQPDLRHLTGRGGVGSVISATVQAHDDEFGMTRLAFAGGTLFVARLDQPAGHSVRVRIHADDVAIALNPPCDTSIRNMLSARILRLSPNQDGRVDVMLECGTTRIWSQITLFSQRHLNLEPGMTVTALLKAVTIARQDVAHREQGGLHEDCHRHPGSDAD